MAELVIQLQVDPTTRRKNIVVSYRSDADALPMEHEEEHRRLVEQLVEGGVLKAEEVGRVIVRRETEQGVHEAASEADAAAERRGHKA